jgi:AraC family transcriptional regulator
VAGVRGEPSPANLAPSPPRIDPPSYRNRGEKRLNAWVTIAPIPVTFGSTERATLDAGGLQISSVVFPARLRLRPHSHERDCISIVLEGWLDKSFGPRRYHSPAASVQTIPADAVHEDVFAPGPTRTLIVEADPEVAERLGAYGLRLDEIRYLRDAGIVALAYRITRELEARDTAAPLAVEGLVLELFALLARRTNEDTGGRVPPWLARAREYVHANFAEAFAVADVAAAVGVHPAHLAREFRRHFGLPIGAYVRRLRLEWAAARLATTDDSLAAIAYAAGFSHQSHFTHAFKRYTGLTPGSYRESVRR